MPTFSVGLPASPGACSQLDEAVLQLGPLSDLGFGFSAWGHRVPEVPEIWCAEGYNMRKEWGACFKISDHDHEFGYAERLSCKEYGDASQVFCSEYMGNVGKVQAFAT